MTAKNCRYTSICGRNARSKLRCQRNLAS